MVDDRFNADEVLVGLTGNILIATSGTTMPADVDAADTAMNGATFQDLGYISIEGASFTYATESTDIPAWQTPDPIRTIITAKRGSLQAQLMQVDEDVFEFAFGGGVWTMGAAGKFVYEFPLGSAAAPEHVLLFNVEDGDKQLVMGFYRATVTGDVTMSFARDSAATLPVTISFNSDPVAGNIGRVVGVVPLGS